ncbi:MAG: hypothetical protein P8Y67_12780 [Alphaproteobacteria bacterium]
MNSFMIYAAAILVTITAGAHSILGERRLIAPLLGTSQAGPGILQYELARRILRYAWHATSLTWIAVAAILIIVDTLPPLPQGRLIVFIIGVSFLVMALISIAISRGRHIGWPFLAAAGIAALSALI